MLEVQKCGSTLTLSPLFPHTQLRTPPPAPVSCLFQPLSEAGSAPADWTAPDIQSLQHIGCHSPVQNYLRAPSCPVVHV